VPGHRITAAGAPLAVPSDFSDEPIREHLGDFPSISPREGIQSTHRAFEMLKAQGKLAATA